MLLSPFCRIKDHMIGGRRCAGRALPVRVVGELDLPLSLMTRYAE